MVLDRERGGVVNDEWRVFSDGLWKVVRSWGRG